jgi:MOSC domain-containing protein YiiM
MQPMTIDSKSVGDPARHVTLGELHERFEAMDLAPTEAGRLHLIVARHESGRRVMPDRARITPETGVAGDAWARGSAPNPEMQIAVMQRDVAELIANSQPLELFGDNLFVELDLSAGNLPPGTVVRIGGATLEVTPMPHNGCPKFRGRFGGDALRFVSRPELRHRNLRGIYMRVTHSGDVATGDAVEVLRRATSKPPHT